MLKILKAIFKVITIRLPLLFWAIAKKPTKQKQKKIKKPEFLIFS